VTGELFEAWVGKRMCLFSADGRCKGPVSALELDFASAPNAPGRARLLIPICEAHRAQRESMGWDRLVAEASLSRADLVNAASLLRGRWARGSTSQPGPFPTSGE
jgi:hypothetical protein